VTACDEGYVLNGQKMFISGADLADVFVVVASIDRQQRSRSDVIVDRDAGLVIGKKLELLGFAGSVPRPSSSGLPYSASCETRRRSRIPGGPAWPGRRRTLGAAPWRSAPRRPRWTRRSPTRWRAKQFGKSIFDFQAVHTMLAEMSIEIDAARLLIWRAAWLRDCGSHSPSLIAGKDVRQRHVRAAT